MSSTALAPVKQAVALTQTATSKILSTPIAHTSTTKNLSTTTPQKTTSSTPQRALATPQSAQGESGRWIHPRMDEVIRRRNATNFDNTNVRVVLTNGAFLISSVLLLGVVNKSLPSSLLASLNPYLSYFIGLLSCLFTANISLAILPLFRKPDTCEDIPLTPSQRKLLGLPAMSRSATAAESQQYVTPPRFSRSATTPRSASSSVRAEASDSPQGDGSSLRMSSFSGSAFGSPTGTERRRLSFNSPRSSPLSVSEFDAAGAVSTPTKGTKASVGLNNKWLYEKGRASPRGSPTGGPRFS